MNLNDIQDMVRRYTEAEVTILQGKSITFNGQQMTMENLSEIRRGRQEWERKQAAAMAAATGRGGSFKLARFPR
ncbi:TPA: hypothetical protein MYQ36_002864 [Citrobacter braakii]|uniref:Primosomal replication protein PriB/PriC domain protein n=1 Tax=Citrobacter portucalensis TaxID=1639133 RepID=A0A5B0SVP8_9ENTR|nr:MULTISPECIES: hypothetical protein [Citrobacter]HCB1916914.1 hypothetical protein [Citrobacter braakii]KAA1140874.1 hypothetical protein D3H66_23500 [Citrobacter portucalensis]MDU5552922.1 hypothetical protein [Citrobacter freundii]MEB2712362.1 hypothetical protein [Citrobacter freundii]MEB2764148.1 hypothetical protein [Citrobacter freundii]